MEEVMIADNLLAVSKRNMEAYFSAHDVQYVAADAVFTHMSTGEEYKGREGVAGLLQYLYHIAFDAKADIKNTVVTENKALLEATFIGRHIGEFAGIPPTGKNVSVPFSICYDLEDGFIKRARVYMMMDVMINQLKS